MSFEDQMGLYAQTKVLIAETGAALANTLLLPDKSTVIELKFGKIADHIWPNFLAQSKLNYMQCQIRVNSITGQGSLDLRRLSGILSSLD
jgi:capsular polysaccharide biosynthesis protein